MNATAKAPPPNLTTEPFDHSDGIPHLTGHRGIILRADTRFQSGRVFSTRFPDVYVANSGDVEFAGMRFHGSDAVAWLRAAAAAIEARLSEVAVDASQVQGDVAFLPIRGQAR